MMSPSSSRSSDTLILKCVATGDYGDMFVACYNWIINAEESKLACANDLYWLVRDNSEVCWPSVNFRAFTAALKRFWEN
ncbi:hypothetical protein RAD16_09660 [Bradyrhizobium sp. 18BD]